MLQDPSYGGKHTVQDRLHIFLKEARKQDYSFRALVVYNSAYLKDLGERTDPLGSAAMGCLAPVPWDASAANAPEDRAVLYDWSSRKFVKAYTAFANEKPTYQAAFTFVSGLVAVHAIETCNCTDAAGMAGVLASMDEHSLIGQVAFDLNGQYRGGYATVQYRGATIGNALVANTTVQYPLPTWSQRICSQTHNCSGHGICQPLGGCECNAMRQGRKCEFQKRKVPACSLGTHLVGYECQDCR